MSDRTSAMRDMSKAIRETIEAHSEGGTSLKDVPDLRLEDFIIIVGAFLADMQSEAEHRGLFNNRPRAA